MSFKEMVFERQLIKLVRERKCLYQTKSRSNKNNKERLVEWQRVSAALRKPVMECRQRWRSLRDRFVREKKKNELWEIAPNSEQQWEFYNEMKFLIPSVKLRSKNKGRVVQQGAKIYLKQDLSHNFANISNSIDEVPHESYSFDEIIETETTTPLPHEFKNETSKQNDAMEQEIMSAEECEDYGEQSIVIKINAPHASEHTKDKDWIEDYFDKNPISPSASENENQNNIHKSNENIPLTRTTPRKSETVTTLPKTTTTAADPAATFVELMTTLKSEINKVVVEEKDENDLFLECMGKKMKKLSQRAKFKIQAKLLESITEELLKEIPE